jgi:hypothetical protein
MKRGPRAPTAGQYRRRCPVCWKIVTRTSKDTISQHRDSIDRDVCPAGGEPYSITEPRRRTVA